MFSGTSGFPCHRLRHRRPNCSTLVSVLLSLGNQPSKSQVGHLGRRTCLALGGTRLTEESGAEFPIELCQTLLTAVAMQPKGQAMPPKVGSEVAIEKMPKAEPSRVDNEVAIEEIAKAESPTVSQEQPQVRGRKESPVITDLDKLLNFGKMAFEQGWYDQARDYFEQALYLDASNREAMKGLARVNEILGPGGPNDEH